MATRREPGHVFLNCPFDTQYDPVFDAIVFAVIDCGFVARCALEIDDAAEVRIEKIFRIIGECPFGIHDISRTELDLHSGLPRFNMPLELGIFLGAKRFGGASQRDKSCLILDRDSYRFQAFISDISGQDIKAHGDEPRAAVRHVRNWLNAASRRKTIPGGEAIWKRYIRFKEQLPELTKEVGLTEHELTFKDYTYFSSTWLRVNS